MKIITVRLSLIAGLLLSSRGVSQAQLSSDRGVCSTTANVAQTACDHDVADSYWIAVGRCLNTSDSAKRESCLAEARDARTEDRNLCSEQFDARDDLCDALGEARYDPPFERGDFVNPLEIGKSINPNRFFPRQRVCTAGSGTCAPNRRRPPLPGVVVQLRPRSCRAHTPLS